MPYYRKKPVIIEAHQWFKNGAWKPMMSRPTTTPCRQPQ